MAREATLAAPVARPLLSRRARELLTGYLYLLPVAIALGGTVLFPILKAMQMSLYNHVLIKPQEYGFVGLANYARLLHDDVFWLTLWNSFLWVFGSVSFQFLGGFAAALLLHQAFRGRSLVRTLTLLPWILGVDLRTTHLREHLIRSLAGIASMYCFFFALAHMRLADAVMLNYSLPLFMPFVESAWLGEEFPRRLWTPVLLGFVGIVLILRPGTGLMQPVALLGLASALFAAVAQVGVRRLTRTEPVARIVFYFAASATVLSALPLAASWTTPPGWLWPAVLAMGATATATI